MMAYGEQLSSSSIVRSMTSSADSKRERNNNALFVTPWMFLSYFSPLVSTTQSCRILFRHRRCLARFVVESCA